MLELQNRKRLSEFYQLIGEMSSSTFYYLPNEITIRLKNSKSKFDNFLEKNILKLLENTNDYLLFHTDFDYNGQEIDGEVYRIDINYGDRLNNELKQVLKTLVNNERE